MSIFIFRRDFRIKDNTAWNKMLMNEEGPIYPIFIFTPEQINEKINKYKSNNSVQFMIESLLELNKEVKITFCYGDIIKVLNSIIKTNGSNNKITSIYTNTDYTPYAVNREKRIQKLCKEHDIKFEPCHDITLFEPNTITNSSGTIYQKYTPFMRACISKRVPKPTTNKSKNIKHVKTSYEISTNKLKSFYKHNDLIHVHGGRNNALKILNHILKFKSYNKTRNILNLNTTNLSAYLKFGCISIREAYHKLKVNKTLIRQLIWREFYYHLGYGFIDRFGKSLKPKYDNIKWINNSSHYKKWCEGRTGFPIVDACMTQLNKTGYMHNRGRLIVSSFLVKNLLINWKYGEKYFAQKLVDYDVLVNQGNWQWTAGSGADSQPYFRIFNPNRQSEAYDKDALYIKKWLPELKDVNSEHLHNWETYYNDYKSTLGSDYPKPIINYAESKINALKLYRKYLK
jgi:deoxyribodipyrimidine photo-lyase